MTFTNLKELVRLAASDTPQIVLGKTAAKKSFDGRMMSFIEGPMVWLVMSKSSQFSVYITSQYSQFSCIVLKTLPFRRSRCILCASWGISVQGTMFLCRVRPSHSIGEEIWRDDWLILQLLSIWTCQNVSECATMDVLIWTVWTVDFCKSLSRSPSFNWLTMYSWWVLQE